MARKSRQLMQTRMMVTRWKYKKIGKCIPSIQLLPMLSKKFIVHLIVKPKSPQVTSHKKKKKKRKKNGKGTWVDSIILWATTT